MTIIQKNFVLLLVFFAIIENVQSQEQQKVKLKGRISDALTGSPLGCTNIQVTGHNLGTVSDSSGNYMLFLPEGSFEIIFQYIGYKTESRIINIPGTEKCLELNILMQPVIIRGEEVTISALAKETAISEYELTPIQLRLVSNPLPEVLLSLKTLPGVSSGNDQSTFYNIRGGNYDENLIYLNGIEIYQPILVRKGIAENPSLVNPALIASINLRTGAFPVSYGDKLSSVLDISYFESKKEIISGSAVLSPVKTELSVKGQPGQRINWFLGFRKINYGYLFKALRTSGDYTPDFQDIQIGFQWRPDSRFLIKFFGLHAGSVFNLAPEEWVSKLDLTGTKFTHMYFNGIEFFKYQPLALGVQLHAQISQKLKIVSGISIFTQYEQENSYIEYYFEESRRDSARVYPSIPSGSPADRIENFDNQLDISLQSLFTNARYMINSRQYLKLGAELKLFRFKDQIDEFVQDRISGQVDPTGKISKNECIKKIGYSWYFEHNWSPSILLFMSIGLRFTEFNYNHEKLILPRFRLGYHLTEKTRLLFSIGKYAQPPLYKELRYSRELQNSDLNAQKSIQITIGIEHNWKLNMSFRMEAYFKQLSDLISYELWDVRTVYSGKNDARGYVYGLDTRIKGDFIPNCYSWVSYSYMVAREDLNYDNEKWIPRPSDQRHTFAATLQDKMIRFPGSKIHIRLLFGSGYHYTTRTVKIDEKDVRTIVKGKRNASKIPHYQRFDVGFSQQFKGEHVSITLREEILNLFDHYNVLGYSWIAGEQIEHALSKRVINMSIEIDF